MGSCFSVTDPISHGNIIHYPSRKQWSPVGNLSGLNVLCLENVEEVLEATGILLTRWGCQVTACRSVEQARLALSEQYFDVIVADYNLDNSDSGLDLLVEVRQQGWNGCGVMITAEQDPGIRTRTRTAGFYFLPKPVDPSSLRTLLKRARESLSGEQVESEIGN
jgi:DNA-binding NtrC family response regulator